MPNILSSKDSRVAELVAIIRKADAAYYNTGDALMEDAAYDALRDELVRLDPSNPILAKVGAPVDGLLAKVTHNIPMGSLNKAMTREEFMAWVLALPNGASTILTGSYKLDGGSLGLDYVDGDLVRAVTRGNGVIGEDVTANAKQFKGVVVTGLKIAGKLFTGSIRCEVVLFSEDWLAVDPDQLSNPRNRVNGIVRRKDGSEAEYVTAVAFRGYWADGTEIASSEDEMLTLLTEAGYTVSPHVTGSVEDIWAFFTKTQAGRAGLSYWIDGVVVKIHDIALQRSLGESDQRPNGQVAIKFAPRGFKTVARRVNLSVGHTGAIIPTLEFDPVVIDGTTVSNALLCNWEEIARLDIAINDVISVYKAGDIIPKVLSVMERPDNRQAIPEPTVCPVCGGPVGRRTTIAGEESAVLYCLSDECPAKRQGKIDRFLRSIDILGIGDEVLAGLIEAGMLNTPADLYLLKNRQDQLESLAMGSKGIRLGRSRAAKILEAIEAKRELTVDQLIGSLGIDGLGKRLVSKTRKAVPGQFDTVEDWLSGKLAEMAVQAGMRNKGAGLSAALQAKAGLVREFLANGVTVKSDAPRAVSANALSFCITGTLSQPRDVYVKLIADKGHVFKDSVAKGLTYLVIADPMSTSSKAEKARKLGTKCIGEAEFLQILG